MHTISSAYRATRRRRREAPKSPAYAYSLFSPQIKVQIVRPSVLHDVVHQSETVHG